ncbi:MAG: amylo-alpha-1,6-glucosidase [Cyanobacteria bacterium P01_H01_bin.15]
MTRWGRSSCGDFAIAESHEWLITNGIGGYGCGTVAGVLTRQYHGYLVAALKPPVGRTLLLAKLEETVIYQQQFFALGSNRWRDKSIAPTGYQYLESFEQIGTTPMWRYRLGDALLRKQIWMEQGQNTTYITYTHEQGVASLTLSLQALVNYRDHHGGSTEGSWRVVPDRQGLKIQANADSVPYFLVSDRVVFKPMRVWYRNYFLAMEEYRGTGNSCDHLHAATGDVLLQPGATVTVVVSTEPAPNTDGKLALRERLQTEAQLVKRWQAVFDLKSPPDWTKQLVLAAEQFLVRRSGLENGRSVIAGYPWFGDWGRDTMISLPGLTAMTGRPKLARPILETFGRYVDQGMIPNLFPEQGEPPCYNTVDASLWYFQAVYEYFVATGDRELVLALFPVLDDIIDWYCRGTRYDIHLDDDGLIYAGEPGTQLTWMDVKVDDWVVTPRHGKAVEINVLWFNALAIMLYFAELLDKPSPRYRELAARCHDGFQRFWQPELGYCCDVLDSPNGTDVALRPNQIFAIYLPEVGLDFPPLLSSAQQQQMFENICQHLFTSFGLRSLSPKHSDYQGHYGGDRYARDGAYHQGTVWGWLLGPYALAHYQVYQDATAALAILKPHGDHLAAAGLGSISEIFDGAPPHLPRGCFAQAWSVAETLRAWVKLTTCER